MKAKHLISLIVILTPLVTLLTSAVYTSGGITFYSPAYNGESYYTGQSITIDALLPQQFATDAATINFFFPNSSLAVTIPVQINGSGGIYVPNAYAFPNVPGTWQITIEVAGGVAVGTINVNVIQRTPLVTVHLGYGVVGQALPQTPTITLTFPNGTTITVPLQGTVNVPSGTSYQVEQAITENNIRWATNYTSGTITPATTSITPTYYQQYLVTFNYTVQGGTGYSPPTVYYRSLGMNETAKAPASVWVDANSAYIYSPELQSNVQGERWIAVNFTGIIKAPGEINEYYINQYLVTVQSQIPVYAIVNGANETLNSTNWFTQGTTIKLENITKYVSSVERYVIANFSPSEVITVNQPTTIKVNTVTQYFINVNSPVQLKALINGANESLTAGWYNQGTSIKIENLTYYVGNGERLILGKVLPSLEIIVNGSYTISTTTITQYFVNVSSPIPVQVLINGSKTILNSSWINAGTSILVLNYTYNISPQERVIIVGISPSQSFTVNSPETLKLLTVTQYLVTINGVSKFYNSGSKIVLNASVPFYETATFKGTYNVSPGATITVNQPITETLVESPNYLILGAIAAVIIIVVAVVVIILLRR
ncbi:hypothetical protein SULI_10965 [Saccharolobus solfataricus]|nr:hypothetical protein [Saccharolobus solfataricus]AKA74362.1 hypothetical protein SULB_2173 [Saccharolobus solfataricus]AKA77058.1 hypothetical protein SULC_2171 [Saccharolobus solfataricus]AKA79750.1 hypothetical protein SULA_2172 [Saccharolobus solfataricus]AZF68845.1 hypothetical protein SULG_10965 [Saccharolobus solfataricus]AZF71465.1 hypothetical protein SULH_10965 [Saccharolobus solfataricus]